MMRKFKNTQASPLKIAYINWLNQHQYDVFATFNFTVGQRPNPDVAKKLFAHFLRNLNKLIYGNHASDKCKVPCLVYPQTGAYGLNAHFHVLFKSPIDVIHFCILLNALWVATEKRAASADQNSITPIQVKHAVTAYGLNEFNKNREMAVDLELSNIVQTEDEADPLDDATDRLMKICDRHIHDARNAFPIHMKQVRLRMLKKEAVKRRAI